MSLRAMKFVNDHTPKKLYVFIQSNVRNKCDMMKT